MNNFNFDGFDLGNLTSLSGGFAYTFGDKIDLSSTVLPVYENDTLSTSMVRASDIFKNSKVNELKLPFGIRLEGKGLFTGMKNLKHLDLSNAWIRISSGTNVNSFQGLESLETLNLNNATFSSAKRYNNDKGYSLYNFGDVTKPKYIDMRNFDNASDSIAYDKGGKKFDLSNLQHELTLNVSENFKYERTSIKFHFGTMYLPESHFKFLPNKLNQPEKLLVICNELNIDDLMSHYNRFYIQPNGSTWEEHNIEFVVDPEFEWNYEEERYKWTTWLRS